MKRIVLLGLTLAFVTLLGAPAEAQDQNSVKQNQSILAYLQAQPFTIHLCSFHERYQLGTELVTRMGEDPSLEKSLRLTQSEAKALEQKLADALVQELFKTLDIAENRQVCSVQTEMRKTSLDLEDEYQIIFNIRKLLDKYPGLKAGFDGAAYYEFMIHIDGFASSDKGQALKGRWIEKNFEAGAILYQLITEEHVAPSKLGLNEKETFKLLEEHR